MTFEDYQREAAKTAIYPGRGQFVGLSYAIIGLVGEVGEVAQKLKRLLRDSNGDTSNEEFRDETADELGDCLWYIAAIAHEIGRDLEDVAQRNVHKLTDRQKRDRLHGAGDKR